MNPLRRMTVHLPALIIGLIVMATMAAILYNLRRGFDSTDESFIYTMIASNRVSLGEAWGFQHLLNPLYEMLGESVLAFRFLRLAGYGLLSVAVVAGLRTVASAFGMKLSWGRWLIVLFVAQIGTFAAWSYPPRYLSYNELASWFSQSGGILILVSLAGASRRLPLKQRSFWALWIAIGMITGLLVFAKVTAGVLFALVVVIVIFVPNPKFGLRKRLMAAVGGGSVMLFLLLASRYPITEYFRNVLSLLFDKSAQDDYDHPLSEMVETYRVSFLQSFGAISPALVALVAVAVLFAIRLRRGDGVSGSTIIDRAAWVCVVLFALGILALPQDTVWSDLGAYVLLVGCAALVTITFLPTCPGLADAGPRTIQVSYASGALVLVSVPFMSAIGTNNGITGQLVFSLTLWSGVLGFGLVSAWVAADRFPAVRGIPPVLLIVFLSVSALGVRGDIVAHPYRTELYALQGTQTNLPQLRGILLTESQASRVNWLNQQGIRLGARDIPALAISAPGDLFAFNRSGFANPWVDDMWPVSYTSVRHGCETAFAGELIVLDSGSLGPEASAWRRVRESLHSCGLSFPEDFSLAAERKMPDPDEGIRIWHYTKSGDSPGGF
jgi:hypothetical protein